MNTYRDFLQQLDELNVKRKAIGQDVLDHCLEIGLAKESLEANSCAQGNRTQNFDDEVEKLLLRVARDHSLRQIRVN